MKTQEELEELRREVERKHQAEVEALPLVRFCGNDDCPNFMGLASESYRKSCQRCGGPFRTEKHPGELARLEAKHAAAVAAIGKGEGA